MATNQAAQLQAKLQAASRLMTTVSALAWFIENVNQDDPERDAKFFRARALWRDALAAADDAGIRRDRAMFWLLIMHDEPAAHEATATPLKQSANPEADEVILNLLRAARNAQETLIERTKERMTADGEALRDACEPWWRLARNGDHTDPLIHGILETIGEA